ncbi:MAG: hypothetical protein J6K61_03330 [Clostridia bacterium]|nr:hypothetical protein [Clostridia bacterium]
MSNTKNEKVEKRCMYCEHSTSEEKDTEIEVICAYKGAVSPLSRCFRFRYDPLKRTPSRIPQIALLAEELFDT